MTSDRKSVCEIANCLDRVFLQLDCLDKVFLQLEVWTQFLQHPQRVAVGVPLGLVWVATLVSTCWDRGGTAFCCMDLEGNSHQQGNLLHSSFLLELGGSGQGDSGAWDKDSHWASQQMGHQDNPEDYHLSC